MRRFFARHYSTFLLTLAYAETVTLGDTLDDVEVKTLVDTEAYTLA